MSNEYTLYIRRCHVCGAINENVDHDVQSFSKEAVIQCGDCGKCLAPFVFCDPEFVKLVSSQVLTQEKLSESLNDTLNQNQNLPSIYPPLVGLALYW